MSLSHCHYVVIFALACGIAYPLAAGADSSAMGQAAASNIELYQKLRTMPQAKPGDKGALRDQIMAPAHSAFRSELSRRNRAFDAANAAANETISKEYADSIAEGKEAAGDDSPAYNVGTDSSKPAAVAPSRRGAGRSGGGFTTGVYEGSGRATVLPSKRNSPGYSKP